MIKNTNEEYHVYQPHDGTCQYHATTEATIKMHERRLDKLEKVVEEIPRMQSKVNTLMSILLATMTILIAISTFSFIQLIDFKKTYDNDRNKLAEQTLLQERRYIDLIGSLSERITSLEHTDPYLKRDK